MYRVLWPGIPLPRIQEWVKMVWKPSSAMDGYIFVKHYTLCTIHMYMYMFGCNKCSNQKNVCEAM